MASNNPKIVSAKYENGKILVKFSGTNIYTIANNNSLEYILKNKSTQKSFITESGLLELLAAIEQRKNYKRSVTQTQSKSIDVKVGNAKASVKLTTPKIVQESVTATAAPSTKNIPKSNKVKSNQSKTKTNKKKIEDVIGYYDKILLNEKKLTEKDKAILSSLKRYQELLITQTTYLMSRKTYSKKKTPNYNALRQKLKAYSIKSLVKHNFELKENLDKQFKEVTRKQDFEKSKDLDIKAKYLSKLVTHEEELDSYLNLPLDSVKSFIDFYNQLPELPTLVKNFTDEDSNLRARFDVSFNQYLNDSNIKQLNRQQEMIDNDSNLNQKAKREMIAELQIEKEKSQVSKNLINVIGEIRKLFKQQINTLNEGVNLDIDFDLVNTEDLDKYSELVKENLKDYYREWHNIDNQRYRYRRMLKERIIQSNGKEAYEMIAASNNPDWNEKTQEQKESIIRQLLNNSLDLEVDKHFNFLENNKENKSAYVSKLKELQESTQKEYKEDVERAKKELAAVIQHKSAALKSKLRISAKTNKKNFNIKNVTSSLNSKSLLNKSTSRLKISPLGAEQVRGIKNMFKPEFVSTVILINPETNEKKFVPLESYQSELKDGWVPKMRSNGTLFTLTEDKWSDGKIFRRCKLKAMSIPEDKIINGICDKYYVCLVAATFFQMLVSNTPIDEYYEYSFIEKRINHNKVSVIGTTKDVNGNRIKFVKDEYDFKQQARARVQEIEHKKQVHKPDDDVVREDWRLHFKGRTFTAKQFMSLKVAGAQDVFERKNDKESILVIAKAIYDETAKSPLTNPNFTYDNTNKRWELLEYGGYKSEETKPRVGSKYGFKHGVKNSHSYQAPKGYLRLVEARWNAIQDSDLIGNAMEEFVNSYLTPLDVSDVTSKLVEELIEYDPSVATDTYDTEKFKRVGGNR